MSPALADALFVGFMALLSLGLMAGGWLAMSDERALVRRIAQLHARPDRHEALHVLVLRRLEPFVVGAGKDREEIEQALALAGYRSEMGPAAFGVLRLVAPLAIGGGLLGLAYIDGHASPRALFGCVMAACIAFLAPKRLLSMSVARRKRRISGELPFTLDVFVMMLESGVSIDHCFRAFAQSEGRAAPRVQEAVEALVRDLERGVAYEAALARWGDRLGVAGARELAAVIQQSLAHGAPAAKVLREFSREFSEKRVSTARESIGRTSAKMTVAMLVFIMPALLIVLAGPAVATLGQAIRAFSH
jgi:tight adherence protein C